MAYNLFAYCNNNPVNRQDSSGQLFNMNLNWHFIKFENILGPRFQPKDNSGSIRGGLTYANATYTGASTGISGDGGGSWGDDTTRSTELGCPKFTLLENVKIC